MRAKMTFQKLEAAIEQGRGIGILDRYKPWITITRSGTSKTSNQSFVRMPCLSRHCCYLSQGERQIAHVLWWAGADDVREQFPLWPWRHPSPYSAIDGNRQWPQHPGMIKVAREAGIPLYKYPGMKIPAVLTIDLMVTFHHRDPDAPSALIGISCKPQEQYTRARPADRLRERLELDRRYCQVAKIKHLLVHPEQLPPVLPRQLQWLAPRATWAELEALRRSSQYQDFVTHLAKHAYCRPASNAIRLAGRKVGWSKVKAAANARTALWMLDVDANLLKPIELHEPLQPGGHALRREIRARIFGEGV